MKTEIQTGTTQPESHSMNRRRFMVATALTTLVPLAGCTGGSDSGIAEAEEPEQEATENEDSQTSTGESQASTEEEDASGVTDRKADEAFVVTEYDWGQQSYGSLYVYGKAENTSDDVISWASITVYLYDEDGARVDEGLAAFSDVRAGEVVNFECVFFDTDSEDDFAEYEIATEASAW